MCVWLTKLLRGYRRDQRGVMAVEFGLILPLLFVILVGIFEFGRYLNEYTVLEQSIRSGVAFASRYADMDDVGGTTETNAPLEITNVIKCGDPTTCGSTDVRLLGWNETGANAPEIKITVYDRDSLAFTASDSNGFYAGTASAFVIRIQVQVIYLPFVTGFMSRFGKMWMRPYHEQVWIG